MPLLRSTVPLRDGTARIIGLPAALDPIGDYYGCVVAWHPDWEKYRQAVFDEQRVLPQIPIERAGPDRSGSGPPRPDVQLPEPVVSG